MRLTNEQIARVLAAPLSWATPDVVTALAQEVQDRRKLDVIQEQDGNMSVLGPGEYIVFGESP